MKALAGFVVLLGFLAIASAEEAKPTQAPPPDSNGVRVYYPPKKIPLSASFFSQEAPKDLSPEEKALQANPIYRGGDHLETAGIFSLGSLGLEVAGFALAAAARFESRNPLTIGSYIALGAGACLSVAVPIELILAGGEFKSSARK